MRDEKYQVLRKKVEAYEEYLDTIELLDLLKERTSSEEKDNLRLK